MSADYINLIRKEWRPRIEALKDDMERRRDPSFFWPNGVQVYVGRQGSGKTSAAVQHASIDLKERYPQAYLVSNLILTEYEPLKPQTLEELNVMLSKIDAATQYIFFEDMEQLELVLTGVNNGFKGVIYLIDEIHTYFNALESKAIEPWVFTEIAQQRKQRKVIIGTSQLFTRMAKPFREQCSNIIFCNTIGGFITRTVAIDGFEVWQDFEGRIHGDIKRKGWFFHTRRLRAAYDTYQKIQSGKVVFDTVTRPTNFGGGFKPLQSRKQQQQAIIVREVS